MGASRLISILAASGMLGLSLPALTACTSYTNTAGPDSAMAGQDPNGRQASTAVATALQWAVLRHPVEGMYVLNLPEGTSTETAERIAAELGPMATVPTEPATDLPVYHIPRVWIRMTDAKVDVVYPMRNALGETIQRGVTVWLNDGVRNWSVARGQYWNPGTVPVPGMWVPIPQAELDAIEAAEKLAREEAEREARRAAAVRDNSTQDRPAAEQPSDAPPVELPEPQADPEPDAPAETPPAGA